MRLLWFLILILFLGNCYSTEKKYSTGRVVPSEFDTPFPEGEPQIEVGRPNKWIDGIGNYFFSAPTKLILFNGKAVNHNVSPEAIVMLEDYLKENNLVYTKVRINQYAPWDDWKRLRQNKRIHWSQRYTVGVVIWGLHTIFPERIFAGLIGGDHYNQFTNTINIYSDLPSVLIHEGGHAKDFESRENRSWYSLTRIIPLIGALYQEGRASDDTFRYFRSKCTQIHEFDSYKQLAPAYSTYIFVETSGVIGIATAIPGHIWGNEKARKFLKSEIPGCESIYENPIPLPPP